MTVHLSDLISRKEAIDLMMQGVQHENDKKYEHLDNKFAYHRYLHGECCYRNAVRLIEKMPSSAEPVRHGHWIEYPLSLVFEKAYSKDHIVCSCCEEAFNVFDNDTERFDYCPHCGSKMDERKEEWTTEV